MLLDVSDAASDPALAFGGSIDGITIASDGSVSGLGAALVQVGKDRTVRTVLDKEAHGAAGLVALSDGSLLFGQGGTVKKVATNGKVSLLAGVTGATRKPGEQVPSSAAAAGYHFGSQVPVPFGVRPDGAVLIADSDVVWALKNGRLSKIFQTSPSAAGKRPTLFTGNAVDGKGRAYVAAGTTADQEHVSDIVVIGANGSAQKIDLPATAEGVQGDPGNLKLTWLAGDGANGVYARAYNQKGDYVLHIRAGAMELVARHSGDKATATCELPRPVDAVKLPCALPYALAYRSGRLVLGGESGYLLDIATQ